MTDSKSTRRKQRWLALWFLTLPFAIGAVFQFLPLWVSIPAGSLLFIFLLAVLVGLAALNEKG